MYFLTYTSIATKVTLTANLQDILDRARIKNAANNLTGLLIFRSPAFFQLLEGEKKDVLATFKKIALDPRHEKVKVLVETEVEDASRMFPSWQMASIGEGLTSKEQKQLMDALDKIVRSASPKREKLLELLKKVSTTLPSSGKEIVSKLSTFRRPKK